MVRRSLFLEDAVSKSTPSQPMMMVSKTVNSSKRFKHLLLYVYFNHCFNIIQLT